MSASSDSLTFANIVHASFREGVFPETLKHAIVRLRLKKPTLSPEDLNSFRPISNLSFVSKIVERVVVARLSRHTDAHHLLPSRQSTYRVNHSTETAVIAVHDYIVRAIDSSEVCTLVLLDLSSAHTVDHETLLRVLTQRFGINDLTLTWFSSYLTGRTQVSHHEDLQSQRSQIADIGPTIIQLQQCI